MQPYRKAAFYTLGCKLNFSETSTIARQLADAGFARVDFSDIADLYVINTCSVTDNADKKCRRVVRQALKTNPNAFVTVVGCYAQLKPEEIKTIPGVDLVLGANEKFNLSEYLDELEKKPTGEAVYGAIKEVKEFVPGYSYGDRTRSFLKVQDGCDYFCSFCTIPLARGRSRSQSVAETMKVARELAATDVREVVLTGVNIGDFGVGRDESFLDLIRELDALEGVDRFRISSIEPNLLTDEIIDFVSQSQRFVPHFHVPLQSGSDDILAGMRRRYRTELYTNRIQRIKQQMPHACIGVDVIVGYPGETEEAFQTTYNYLTELDVSYLHVFTYSERPNTVAVRHDGIVPMPERHKRSKMLQILSNKKRRAFYESSLGGEFPVLFEAEAHGDYLQGFTSNYVKVKYPYSKDLVNQLMSVRLTAIDRDGLVQVEPVAELAE